MEDRHILVLYVACALLLGLIVYLLGEVQTLHQEMHEVQQLLGITHG